MHYIANNLRCLYASDSSSNATVTLTFQMMMKMSELALMANSAPDIHFLRSNKSTTMMTALTFHP